MPKKIIFGIVIVIVIVLLIPIPSHIKDGGSICYHAVLYEVTKYHSMTEDPEVYLGGWTVKILNRAVYEHTYLMGTSDK